MVGLHINHNKNKIVAIELRRTSKTYKIVRSGETSIYPEGVSEDKKNIYLSAALDKVFREHKFNKRDVIYTIPTENIMIRHFQMPMVPKNEIESIINFEAKKHIPFPTEDVVFDFQIIPNESLPNTMDVVFIAIKKETLENHISVLEGVGVKPLIVEPEIFSLIRLFNKNGMATKEDNTAISVLTKKGVIVSIIRRGIPYIIREVAFNENDLHAKSLDNMYEKIFTEIWVTIGFYKKQFPSAPINKVVIYGEGDLRNLSELLEQGLQISVEVGSLFENYIGEDNRKISEDFTISFGSAIRKISEPIVDLNLYKKHIEHRIFHRSVLKVVLTEILVAALLLICLNIVCVKKLLPIREELKQVMAEKVVTDASFEDNSIPSLQMLTDNMQREKSIAENVISKRTYLTSRLKKLRELVPENFWLNEINFKEKMGGADVREVVREFSINGYYLAERAVKDIEAVDRFLATLKKDNDVNKGLYRAAIIFVKKLAMKGEQVVNFTILLDNKQ